MGAFNPIFVHYAFKEFPFVFAAFYFYRSFFYTFHTSYRSYIKVSKRHFSPGNNLIGSTQGCFHHAAGGTENNCCTRRIAHY